ncbi:hypothetical protein SANTM175S_06001 [Streptomyces antimycoticus]
MENTLTLERLIADIGQPLLRLAVDPHEAAEPLTGVLIHDPSDTVGLEAGCLVLCVGLASGSELVSLGREARRAGVCGLAVKSPLPPEAVDCPVPVVEVNRHASWMHVATITRQRIQDYARAQWEPAGATSDLFAIANTVSMVIHAPVTIEDATSAVLAWSAGQEKADESRVETILGRAVRPWRVRKAQRTAASSSGSMLPRRRCMSNRLKPTMLPRVAVAVRAGSEVLGYVWAVTSGPLPEEHARSLEELFTSVVALHLANMRADSSPGPASSAANSPLPCSRAARPGPAQHARRGWRRVRSVCSLWACGRGGPPRPQRVKLPPPRMPLLPRTCAGSRRY